MLVIEIDGGIHASQEAQAYDAQRTKYLESHGFSVLRVPNHAVKTWSLSNIMAVPEVMGKRMRAYKETVGRLAGERIHPSGAVTVGPVVI
jgi:very-short-patch-repair endonuclease